jgi:hypothetical protein
VETHPYRVAQRRHNNLYAGRWQPDHHSWPEAGSQGTVNKSKAMPKAAIMAKTLAKNGLKHHLASTGNWGYRFRMNTTAEDAPNLISAGRLLLFLAIAFFVGRLSHFPSDSQEKWGRATVFL